MTDRTVNLVLEPPRGMRADIAKPHDDISAVRERRAGIDRHIEGRRSVAVATLVTGMRDHDTPVARLGGATP